MMRFVTEHDQYATVKLFMQLCVIPGLSTTNEKQSPPLYVIKISPTRIPSKAKIMQSLLVNTIDAYKRQIPCLRTQGCIYSKNVHGPGSNQYRKKDTMMYINKILSMGANSIKYYSLHTQIMFYT